MADQRFVEAGGGVVWRKRDDGKPVFLVVHRPRYDDWSLPKGKLDRGESFQECAEREVREETGSRVKVGDEIGTIAYRTGIGNRKRVRYWLMEELAGKFKSNSEVDEIQWLRPKRARAKLTYSRDRAVLDRAIQMVRKPSSGRIYLVRHALAGDRNQWKASDRKRPLSQRGRAQALALDDFLSRAPIVSIHSSKWVRCHKSVTPLANTLGLEINHSKALIEGGTARAVIELIQSLAETTSVLCSHGDVIERYMTSLAADGVRIDGPPSWKKGSIWILETRKGRAMTARYLPPPTA